MNFTFRPLDQSTWPEDGRQDYVNCRFRSAYSSTMKLLSDELWRISVNEAVIELDLSERDIRRDGLPRSDAKPKSPRVRVSFEHPEIGPLQYPCDTYNNYADNMRGIAMTLAAQRAMDRYGATRRNQQYAGWKQLPGQIEIVMTVELAARFIAESPGGYALSGDEPGDAVQFIIDDVDYYREAYRQTAKHYHPDTGGSEADFVKLQEARRVLDQHHGL